MFADPKKNIESFGLIPGMTILDVGAGSGAYTMLAAREVGGLGKVYAFDVQKDLLTRIKQNAQKEHLGNVEVIWGDIEKKGGTKLRDSIVDGVIMSNVLFQIPHKETARDEIFRVLKPGGRIFLVDWTDSFGGLGPQAHDVITAAQAKQLFATGFSVDREFGAGAHHYGIIFKKQ